VSGAITRLALAQHWLRCSWPFGMPAACSCLRCAVLHMRGPSTPLRRDFKLVINLHCYSITGATAMHTAAQRMGSSFSTKWAMTVLLGGIELIFSQVQTF